MKCVKCKDTGIVKFKYLVDKPLDPYCECEIGQKKKMWKSLIDGQKELQKAIIDAEPLPKYVCGLDFSKSESETLYGYFGNMQTPISVRKMEKIFKETIAAWKKFESECEKLEKPTPLAPPECRTVNNLGASTKPTSDKKLRNKIVGLETAQGFYKAAISLNELEINGLKLDNKNLKSNFSKNKLRAEIKELKGKLKAEMTNSNTRSEHLELLINDADAEIEELKNELRLANEAIEGNAEVERDYLRKITDKEKVVQQANMITDTHVDANVILIDKCEELQNDNTTLQNEIKGLKEQLAIVQTLSTEPAKDFDYPCVVISSCDGLTIFAEHSTTKTAFKGCVIGLGNCVDSHIGETYTHWSKSSFKQIKL